jgi:deoxyribonuclease V
VPTSGVAATLTFVTRWPSDAEALDAEQRRLAAATPPAWTPAPDRMLVGGVFVAYAAGEQGPGHPGDRAWVGAAVVECPRLRLVGHVVVPVEVGASYEPGRLALREGPALTTALTSLEEAPDVVLVDASGRDHPRGAGLALHLGAVVDLPSVGVTHRPLVATGEEWPADEPGSWSPLTLDGQVVAAWLRTSRRARPVVVHPAWRTDLATAVDVVRPCCGRWRTPEPLRVARVAARTARAYAEGRTPFPWRPGEIDR